MESCCEVSRTFKVAYWINREFGTGWWYDTREAEAAGGNRIESVLSFTFCPSKSEAVTISIGINNQSSWRSHWPPHATTGHLCEESKLAFAVLHWWSGFSHSLLVLLLLFSKLYFLSVWEGQGFQSITWPSTTLGCWETTPTAVIVHVSEIPPDPCLEILQGNKPAKEGALDTLLSLHNTWKKLRLTVQCVGCVVVIWWGPDPCHHCWLQYWTIYKSLFLVQSEIYCHASPPMCKPEGTNL